MSAGPSQAGAPQIAGLVYVQPLGSGGYADVYLYEQQSPRMPVAVKVLRTEGMTDTLRRQFVDEADTMAQLGDHPYIVQVFRAGTSDDDRPYLVMKYYPPPNLASRARAQRFSVEDVLRTGIQLASAIETAHQAGIIHRDIKPANVLVSAYGAPGLTDFGIAGRGQREPGAEVGVSVPWAPPEVLYAVSDGDERGDVYSLAATLWQLLVGRSPFEVPGGDNTAYALMPRIRTQPVPPTGRPDVPVSLERLLAQAMSKDPNLRPPSAIELARALQAVEQELRLPRTPVVVLDSAGQTRLLGQQGATRPDDSDATRVKSPQAVRAQHPTPSGATRVDETDAADNDRLVDDRTHVAAAATPPRSRVPLVLAVAAAVVVVVLAGYLILRPRAAPVTDQTRTPVSTTNTTDDSAIGDGVFTPPTVSAVAKVGAVDFSWSYPGPKESDTYRVHIGATGAAAEEADPVTLKLATYEVKVPSGTPMCAVVTVVRGGQISPAAKPVCATAQ